MKKAIFILSIITFVAGGCGQNKPTADNLETALPTQTEDTIVYAEIKSEQQKIVVLVLPPRDETACQGISPPIDKYLETTLAMDSMLSVMKFPYKRMNGAGYHQVFDKKYCKTIIEKIETDIIIMSDLTLGNSTKNMQTDSWNVRFRIYNVKTDKQIDSKLKVVELNGEEMNNFIVRERNVLISEIKALCEETEIE